jgi:phytoene desaturase
MPKALIIGSGLGGLATALRLSSKGYEVEIVEKYHKPGGRLNQFKKDGFTFDVGPSFFSMSYEFDELFKSCGIPNPLTYEELDPIYSVYFRGKKDPYLIYKDLDRLAKEFAAIEPEFRQRIEKYLNKAGEIFHDTEHRIVKKNFDGKLDYLLQMMKVPFKHLPFLVRSMWDNLDKHFSSQEAKVIFSLVAFFLGSTPFQTPAVYSLLNYTELQHDGYWNIKGGMYRIVEEIVTLLEARNVKFHFNTEIKGYHNLNGTINTFIDQNGKSWTADVFVVNADAAAFRGKVLGQKSFREAKLDKMEWTLAPFTMYLGLDRKLEGLVHHNYFLGDNFNDYASQIFSSSISPEKPYYYVNMSSYSNPDCAPEGGENIFILCPVPDMRFKPDWSDKEKLADNILADFSERVGVDIQKHLLVKEVWSPDDWERKFNLYKGSGLGLAHGLNQVGGLRPANVDRHFKNVFYVGASTIPGTGLPIVVMSSKLVTDRILNHG